jgi:glycosyltransferase involved in cell wall biosynthesis
MNKSKLSVVGVSYPYRGGIAHYSTCLVRYLRKFHEVGFVSFSRQYPNFLFPGKTQYDESANPIQEQSQRIIDSINPITWWRAARTLEKQNSDLIVINWWHPFFGLCYGAIILMLSKRLKARVCFLCHNVLPHERTFLEKILCMFAFKYVNYFIVHSSEDREKLLKLKPTAKVLTNCHPVFSQFDDGSVLDQAAARKQLGISTNQTVILFFGLIRPYKGLDILIKAIPRIIDKIKCTLLIAGEFYDDKTKYIRLIENLGIAQHVRVEDKYIPNEAVHAYFAASNVVVLPYIEASQSGIVPIAYSFGTPVISTRVGGLPEAVFDNETGLLVEAGDPEALADKIIYFHEKELEMKFRRNIATYVEKFGCQEEVNNIEHFIDLNQRRA